MTASVEILFPPVPLGTRNAIDTIAQLRALDSTNVDSYTEVAVAAVPGFYKFNPSTLAADDGLNVVKPDDLTSLQAGRWLLLAFSSGTLSFLQSGTDPVSRSVQDKLRDTVNAADFGFSSDASADDNDLALTNAMGNGRTVYLPDSDDVFNFGSVDVPLNTRLIGAGPERTRLVSNFLAFACLSDTDAGDVRGPTFEEFTLTAPSGIKINSSSGGFAGSPVQGTVFWIRITRVRFVGPGGAVAGSIGLEINKCFSAVVDQCWFQGFERGIKSLGSDFPHVIGGCRFRDNGIHVDVGSSTSWGSGMIVDGADLLNPLVSFIVSSDRDLTVRDNYFEATGSVLTGPAISITHTYAVRFTGNRIEVPAAKAAAFLTVTGEGQLFAFRENKHSGDVWGATAWNAGTGARYVLNTAHRQQIIASNNASPVGVPFNAVEPDPTLDRQRNIWLLSPNSRGFLTGYNYNETCRVIDGAFVLPPINTLNGSRVRFKDTDYPPPAAALVDIWIEAKGTIASQEVKFQRYDGASTAGAEVTQALITGYVWYRLANGVVAGDLALDFRNIDVGHNGSVYLREVIVRLTSEISGSLTWDPGSLADGAGETSSAITVTGAAFGDAVTVAAPYDLQGITCNGYVSATNTVKIRLQNETTGVIDLGSGSWAVKVLKA